MDAVSVFGLLVFGRHAVPSEEAWSVHTHSVQSISKLPLYEYFRVLTALTLNFFLCREIMDSDRMHAEEGLASRKRTGMGHTRRGCGWRRAKP